MKAAFGEECTACSNRGTLAWILIATLVSATCSVSSNPYVDLVLYV